MHQSVLLDKAVSYLNLSKGAVVVDATVGGGGHSEEMLKSILPGGRLVGIDADLDALAIAGERLKNFNGSFTLVNDNFRNIDRILKLQNIKDVDAVLLDIGVSSYQLDDASRGFSIKSDAALDMRMDRSSNITAYDVVNKYKEDKLSEIIEKFGEERYHDRIARFIKDARDRKDIQIVVISFHSLEDRIVKNIFKGYSKLGVLKIITKKPLIPEREEIIQNPRSRSAKLRVAERIERQS